MKQVAIVGMIVMLLMTSIFSAQAASAVWQVERPNGFDENSFGDLTRVAVGNKDTIYVGDSYNGIQVLDADGNVVDLITPAGLSTVDGVAVSPDGSLWVTSTFDNKLLHLSASGDVLAEIGGKGSGAGQFGDYSPTDVVVDSQGNAYAFDTQVDDVGSSFGRIQVFDSKGNFQYEFLTDASGNGDRIYGVLAMGADGNLYIGDFWGGLAVLDRQGNVVTKNLLNGDLEFAVATAVTLARDGTIYFATDGTIYQISPKGDVQDKFGSLQNDDQPMAMGNFSEIMGLGVLSGGDVVASDASAKYSQIVRVSFQ